MKLLRVLFVLFLGVCVVGFGLCGAMGFVGALSSIDSLINGNAGGWFSILGLSLTGWLIAWLAYKGAAAIYRDMNDAPAQVPKDPQDPHEPQP